MTIQFCSDLHLEFEANRKWFAKHPLEVCGEVLIIAGDTYYLNRDFAELDFIQLVSKQYQEVYIIAGNHEYYGGFDAKAALEPFEIQILTNVSLLNDCTKEINGINYIFSTLWSKIERNVDAVRRGMADFREIMFDGFPLTVANYNELHKSSLSFIQQELAKEGRKVVVSHHLPSELCNVAEFTGSLLNEGFCVDLTDLIESTYAAIATATN